MDTIAFLLMQCHQPQPELAGARKLNIAMPSRFGVSIFVAVRCSGGIRCSELLATFWPCLTQDLKTKPNRIFQAVSKSQHLGRQHHAGIIAGKQPCSQSRLYQRSPETHSLKQPLRCIALHSIAAQTHPGKLPDARHAPRNWTC